MLAHMVSTFLSCHTNHLFPQSIRENAFKFAVMTMYSCFLNNSTLSVKTDSNEIPNTRLQKQYKTVQRQGRLIKHFLPLHTFYF